MVREEISAPSLCRLGARVALWWCADDAGLNRNAAQRAQFTASPTQANSRQ
jgi:hypothetical protein